MLLALNKKPNKTYPRVKFAFLFLVRTGIAQPCLFIAAEDISLPLISAYMSIALVIFLLLLFFILESSDFVAEWWNPVVTIGFWFIAFLLSVLALFGYPTAWIAIPILIDSTWSLKSYFIYDPYADPVTFDPEIF